MSIKPVNDKDVTLFHTIDKQWRSDNVVTFTFHPKHESEARSIFCGCSLLKLNNDMHLFGGTAKHGKFPP